MSILYRKEQEKTMHPNNKELLVKDAKEILVLKRNNIIEEIEKIKKSKAYAKDLTELILDLNNVNELFKNKKALSKIDSKINKIKDNNKNTEALNNYLNEEKIYYEYAKKSLSYSLSYQEKKLKNQIHKNKEIIKQVDLLRLNASYEKTMNMLVELSFYKLLKKIYMSDHKDCIALEEILKLGTTSTKNLFSDEEILEFSNNITILEKKKQTLKTVFNFKKGLNILPKEIEDLKIKNKKLEDEINIILKTNSKKICSF